MPRQNLQHWGELFEDPGTQSSLKLRFLRQCLRIVIKVQERVWEFTTPESQVHSHQGSGEKVWEFTTPESSSGSLALPPSFTFPGAPTMIWAIAFSLFPWWEVPPGDGAVMGASWWQLFTTSVIVIPPWRWRPTVRENTVNNFVT